ncbi:tetratricopeptide repeat protein [Oceanicoccus sagamiensis]|uniref:tetratricopeptide repeat protein n=1 Tax=Oceanicoccus sagamiensis TaxID=716816 RepID=UPI001F0B64CB|nr:tetratricopeptide repeat protein [Oceanicoccus sagamiensis]
MMPVFGSDPVAALTMAKQLFRNAGVSNGRVLLITDGVTDNDVDDIDNLLSRSGYELSIMGVGTPDGAPIPARSGFLKDDNGNIIVPQLQRSRLEQLAKYNSGRYTDISLNDNDVSFLLTKLTTELEDNTVLTEREFDQWHDRGPLLALALLPFALLAFRRGWLLILPLLIMVQPQTSHAFEWQDLWQRADQQAAKALEQGDAKAAAKLFKDEQWQASANYKAGDFKNAAQQFAQQDNATGHYNRGNALAKAGQLDKAIAAYNKALTQQPDMEDAAFNKQLLEQLKQQQEQQQEQQQQENQDGEQSDEESQDSEQQDQQQGDPQNQDSEQQQDDQQDSEQQSQQDPQENQDQQDSKQDSEQQDAEESEQEQQQQTEQSEEEQQQSEQQQAQASEQDQQSQQEKQAMEQWLRQIPDDPSGLLRRKFNHESQVRQQQGETQREQPQW